MIKYLGSKRRLAPVLGAIAEATGARSALDLFTGTTRIAQEFKRRQAFVTAVDTARYSEMFARCYIETDAAAVDKEDLAEALAYLDSLPGRPGYVTDTFCVRSRYLQPHNGARIDAIREEIERTWRPSPLYPILLTALIEAADRVDSTTGVQMAYVKRWSARSYRPLRLRAPELLPGTGRALRGDACDLVHTVGHHDLAYLDPPYNQHRYDANYHVWETLVAWDAPAHYGVACKRVDIRDPANRSVFNRRAEMPAALCAVLGALDADLVVLSYNDESWIRLEELQQMCAVRGHVDTLAFDSRRYVGALIGIHNHRGEKVGTVRRTRNVEYLLLAGPRELVHRAVAGIGTAVAGLQHWRSCPNGRRH
ncbi:MAG: DNA methyltransferase [Acidimicrobiia bacterium]